MTVAQDHLRSGEGILALRPPHFVIGLGDCFGRIEPKPAPDDRERKNSGAEDWQDSFHGFTP
jgi:hypothetical protein